METVEIKPLVIEVDGVKTPDYVVIEELYGEQLVGELKNMVDHYNAEKRPWDLKVLKDDEYSAQIALYTQHVTNLFEIGKWNKSLRADYIIGKHTCEDVLELMNSVEAVERA